MRVTDVLDVREHPRLHTELHGTGNNGRDDLSPEHGTRRHLHVVAKLEVGRELESLEHRDVAPGLEHHHCNRTSRERVADDELSDDIETDLLVGDSLDHTDGDNENEGDYKRQDERPDRELCRPDFDGYDTEDEHRNCRGKRSIRN